jgi:hypothetical protein
MLFAATTMVFGLVIVATLSQAGGYRLGGVLVLPLLVIYTFREPVGLPIFVVATAAAWGALWVLREFTLAHGRRVFLVAVTAGALASVVGAVVSGVVLPDVVGYADTEVVGSIFPGIAAYNLMRVDEENRLRDVTAFVGSYLGLLLLGMVALPTLRGIWATTPPFVLLSTSGIPQWLGVEPVPTTFRSGVPEWFTVGLLLVDVSVYELVRSRYDLRLAGIVLIPLLAVFAADYGAVPLVYAVGATVVFVLVSVLHWLSLLYGRNLLAVALVSGVLYSLVFGAVREFQLAGSTLFFTGVFTGIGAYNLHRTAPRNRGANVRLSAGLFVVFYGAIVALDFGSAAAVLPTARGVNLLVAAAVLGLATLSLYRLERSVPDAAAFERASVFAEVSDGAPDDVGADVREGER